MDNNEDILLFLDIQYQYDCKNKINYTEKILESDKNKVEEE